MRATRLDAMARDAVGYDTETHLIQPGLVSPPIVCASVAETSDEEPLTSRAQIRGALLDKPAARSIFTTALLDPRITLCGANVAYDMLVHAVDAARNGVDLMPMICAMYDTEGTVVRGDCDGRVFDVQLAEGLHAIAQGHLGKDPRTRQAIINPETGRPGRYSLRACVDLVLGRDDAKANDRFRLSYALLDDVPLTQWPYEARTYPIDDAVNTLETALAQAGHLPSCNAHVWVDAIGMGAQPHCAACGAGIANASLDCMQRRRRRNLHALSLQVYFAWASHVGSAWGLHVPQDLVDKLEAKIDAHREAHVAPFKAAGIVRDDDTENQSTLKKLVAIAYGASAACPTCFGTGKVPSPKTAGRTKINCDDCDGTALQLPPEVPRSEGGGVAKARDVLIESGDELLMEYGEQPSKKIKTTYVPLMRRGRACTVCGRTGCATKYTPAHEPWCTSADGSAGYRPVPLIVRTDPLKETLRAAIEDGLHSMPRQGGVRECFCSRPGYVFSSEDYKAGELVTLSDACLTVVGWSKLAEALNSGLDPHLALAGEFCGKTYDVMLAAKKAKESWLDFLRQVAKKSNFGFGGGMAELEFVLKPCRADPASFTPCEKGPSQRNFGTEEKPKWVRGFSGTRPCIMMDGQDYCGRPGEKILFYNDRPTGSPVCMRCLAAGKNARAKWFAKWPEMRDFFKVVKRLIEDVGPSGTPEIDYPDLVVRGGLGFCDGANGYFQMKLAKAAKAAFCQVQRECIDRTWRVRSSEMMPSRYDGLESPLFGSRAILLFHDEIVAEHPESIASDGAKRVSEVMVESLRFACPRMYKAIEAEPTLMRRLYKGAEPRYAIGGDKPASPDDALVCWEPKKVAA